MQAPGNQSTIELFTYSARLVPSAFKNGRPKLWAVNLFEDEISLRFCELQGYFSSVAKQRDVRSPDGQAGRSLSVECGRLWPLEDEDYHATLNTAGDPRYIGPVVVDEAEPADRTYLLALYMDGGKTIRPSRRPVTCSMEFEVCLVSDSEELCEGVADILTSGLPEGMVQSDLERIGMSMEESGKWNVYYNGSPFVGSVIPVIKARFG